MLVAKNSALCGRCFGNVNKFDSVIFGSGNLAGFSKVTKQAGKWAMFAVGSTMQQRMD